MNHEAVFAAAWADPASARFTVPPLDVNLVLREHYRLDKPLTFTRNMLWDTEVRKAWHPDLYIPAVVVAGSAAAWIPEASPVDERDTFVRISRQRRMPGQPASHLIIEQVLRNHAEQKVTFIGAAEHPGKDGIMLRADTSRPLFHVEHGAAGDDDRPLNTFKVVVPDGHDAADWEAAIKAFADPTRLPEFIEIYIRDVLGIGLTRLER